jgi:hypothetical protein
VAVFQYSNVQAVTGISGRTNCLVRWQDTGCTAEPLLAGSNREATTHQLTSVIAADFCGLSLCMNVCGRQ